MGWWPGLLILPALLLAAGLAEGCRHAGRLKRIPIRILVNGTRGKTSVTRLIAAALNEGGIRAVAKCTGSDPREILPDGTEVETHRPRGARITELFGFVRRAWGLGAQALVVECMAVLPETQQALARQLVRPTITVITNATVDHVEELGATPQDTARGLAFSLHHGTALVTGEAYFAGWTPLFSPDQGGLPPGYLDRFTFPVFEENIRLALAAAALAEVSREDALEGMAKARPDIGMAGPFHVGNTVVVNSFAANDPTSTARGYEKAGELVRQGMPLKVVYNHRADRAYRLKGFVPFLQSLLADQPLLYAIGDNPKQACRYFRRRLSMACRPLDPARLVEPAFYEEEQVVFCMGNIKGDGADMIRYCLERHKEPDDADRRIS